jgi:hypothetical protein
MFDRDTAIECLINDDIDSIVNGGYCDTLLMLLAEGFKGYNNFTDDELAQELKERGLEEGFGI